MAAAFVVLNGGSAPSKPVRYAAPVTSMAAAFSYDDMQNTGAVRHEIATLEARIVMRNRAAAARKHHAAATAAHHAQQAPQQAQPTAQPTVQPTVQPAPAATPAPTAQSGGDAAHSALGICIRNAEEGGSYAWGPGNGGGAYQFLLGTWEKYGGAASEYGVAGPAYQDQIFDNAIAAGGASNWTAYDGC
ncbi:MAG: transglycosylase family protein [Streptosporangiaceae bacterium]|nr:transglycosylase family protein [Streptosporangiaceae bacterium]